PLTKEESFMNKIKKILWPTDFSPLSEKAIEPALTLAEVFEAQIIICHIVSPMPVSPDVLNFDVTRYEKEMLQAARSNLDRLAQKLREKNPKLQIKTVVEIGTPAESITQIATKFAVDLIVISTHGRTGFNHLLFGSVAERVIRTALCPVLVVRAQATPQR
ncbi:MAG: universal stress protein, partial [Candidatus Omnitrophica bacterium]|nr:universal stress protein [Candidatus Omnitrophota bacterium]